LLTKKIKELKPLVDYGKSRVMTFNEILEDSIMKNDGIGNFKTSC
jgi:hypothetical protein